MDKLNTNTLILFLCHSQNVIELLFIVFLLPLNSNHHYYHILTTYSNILTVFETALIVSVKLFPLVLLHSQFKFFV